jgi:DNA-binding NarL/FixJ family response regulator
MRTYLVEDHEPMRIILKRLLKRNFPSFTVAGEADSAEEALRQIPRVNPDLALVDISLPGMDGIELIRRLKPLCHSLCILVVTGHEVSLYRGAALEAGADDIVSKYDDRQLLDSIRTLFDGRQIQG